MVYIQSRAKGLKRKHCLSTRSDKRRLSSTSWTSYRMQVNVMRQLIVGVVLQSKLNLISYSRTDKTSWNSFTKSPVYIFNTISHFTTFFYDFYFSFKVFSFSVANWLWNIRWCS